LFQGEAQAFLKHFAGAMPSRKRHAYAATPELEKMVTKEERLKQNNVYNVQH